jgi:hypothetical protein
VQTGTQRDQVTLVRPLGCNSIAHGCSYSESRTGVSDLGESAVNPPGILIHSHDELLYAGVFNSMRNQKDALGDAAPAYEFVSPADMRTARLKLIS